MTRFAPLAPLARRTAAAALLTLALFAGASTAVTPAAARVNGPVFDSFSAGCLSLQNDSDSLVGEYKNATPARREEIIGQLRNIGSTWNQIGCKAVFGSISMIVKPVGNTVAATNIETGGVLVAEPVPIGGHFVMNPKDAAMAVRDMIRPKYALPIHYGTTPQLAGTTAEFNAALGIAPGTPRMLVVNPGEKVEF